MIALALALSVCAGVSIGFGVSSAWAGSAAFIVLTWATVLTTTLVSYAEDREDRRHDMQLTEFLQRLERDLRESDDDPVR